MARVVTGGIVAGVVYWLVQAAWFTALSGPWVAGLGYPPERIAEMQATVTATPFVIALACNVAMATVLGVLMRQTGCTTAVGGLQLGFLAWAGFVVTALVTEQVFEGRPATFMAVSSGAPLLGLLLMGGIQGLVLSRRGERAATRGVPV